MAKKSPSPTIASLKMVEQAIKNNNGSYTRTALWKALPRKMKYQNFKSVLNYFVEHNQVVLARDGRVVFIHFPTAFKALMKVCVPLKKNFRQSKVAKGIKGSSR